MKTLRKQIKEMFEAPFNGHTSRQEENDIEVIKQSILKLAKAIDNLTHHFDD